MSQKYINSFQLKATMQTMNVISTVLRFDVVELWKYENNIPVCVYIHAEKSILRMNTSIISSESFYPADGRKHMLSPKLCDIARRSGERYYWRVADETMMGKNGKPVLYPEHPTPYQTEMAYHVDLHGGPGDLFIIAFALGPVPFSNSRLKFLNGVSYAVCVAAFDLEDVPIVPSEAGPVDRAINKELDDVHAKPKDPVETAALMSVVDPHGKKGFLYPLGDVPVVTNVANINFRDIKNLSHLADGSHSNVFLGTYDGNKVVVKMIMEESNENPVAQTEYDLELALLSRLDHPNITKLIGRGNLPRKFLVLEYLGGGILSSILEANEMKSGSIKMFHKPTFTYQMLLIRARELASVMHYLHHGVKEGATLIHRDLKPDNIGFTEEGVLKLLDFGLCTCVRARRRSDIFYEMTGNTGSLRYMAPEVALRKPYGEKVDVHSFGIILWQMARDKVPFDGMDANEFMTSVVKNKERPKLDKSWPEPFSHLLVSCWNNVPTARPSFREIVIVLDGLLGINAPNALSNVSSTPNANTIKKGQSGWF